MLGDLPEGDGDPSLCIFGESITPNQHALARTFVLLDNTYCAGILSADGHNWSTSAFGTDYLERSFAGWPRSYPDGMLEHDDDVGRILAKIKQLGIDDNTIVFYSTDNGAETFTWPDGGTIPFHGEKGTTWEGGFRVPAFIKWPGVIKPGTKLNGIASHEDMIPTLLAAVGEPNIKEKLKKGYTIDGKTYKVHLDGYNLLPWFKGEVATSPRKEIMYFDQAGNLNAIRYNNWKAHFAILKGNIASAVREQTAWPKLINLRADPFERAWHESEMYLRWMAENMWVFVPAQVFTRQWLESFKEFPPRGGTTLGIDGVIKQLENPASRQ